MSKVLLLDNSEGQLKRLAQHLARAGISVIEGKCVISALEQAHEEIIDLIVSCERLPSLGRVAALDVFDLLELRNERIELSDIPVVIVSNTGKRKLECFKLGCDDFIQLPVDEPELIFRVCAILRRSMRSGLSGSFEQVSLVDLLQMLVAARRDGRLELDGKDKTGVMYIREGQVIHAICGGQIGERAVLALLRSCQGTGFFVFVADSNDRVQATINKRTDHLLLGLANMIDEGKG